jgi:hypothetical protein
VNYFFEK